MLHKIFWGVSDYLYIALFNIPIKNVIGMGSFENGIMTIAKQSGFP